MDLDQPQSSTGNTSSGYAGSDSTTSPTIKQDSAGPSGSGGSITGRKRKVPDSVTPNACTNCKKARAKCDGVKPACKRCVYRHVQDECHYDVHAKTAKEQMVREIQRLQRKTDHLEEENSNLEEKNEWTEAIMNSLKHDSQGSEIIRRLKRGETHQGIAEWLGRPIVPNTEALSPVSEFQFSAAIERYHRGLVENHDPRYWTNVTDDPILIEHLVALYLTWVHPAHMLFDEVHFMEAFKACSDTYCSPPLVNAICAMSCHLLYGVWENEPDSGSGMESLGNQFLAETKALMTTLECTKMTVIQTYGILFLVELGSGHGLKATSHLRLATESLVAKNNPEQSSESSEVASWGLLTLHTAWSGLIFQKPSAPISTHANVFRGIDTQKDDGPWRFYKEPGNDTSMSRRPSYLTVTAFEHAKLYRIIHETILVFCGTRGKVSAHHMLTIYERYLEWKERLPPPLAAIEGTDEVLPHALFLHVQYHVALLQLFQPLLHLDKRYKASHDYLQSLVLKHAKTSLAILMQYRDAYSFRYLSPILLFCIVHTCDALVRYDDKSASAIEIARFCLESLDEAKVGYPLAGTLQRMFRLALDDYSISLPDELERLCGPAAKYGLEELLDACTRPSYRQPIAQMLPNLEPSLAQDFMDDWQKLCEERPEQDQPVESTEPTKQHSMQIDSLLNR